MSTYKCNIIFYFDNVILKRYCCYGGTLEIPAEYEKVLHVAISLVAIIGGNLCGQISGRFESNSSFHVNYKWAFVQIAVSQCLSFARNKL